MNSGEIWLNLWKQANKMWLKKYYESYCGLKILFKDDIKSIIV